MLSTASVYLAKKPTKNDVLSAFAGIRPLLRSGDKKNTAALSAIMPFKSIPPVWSIPQA